jgi:formylglycine-generating enzyme required for sulfatase activity
MNPGFTQNDNQPVCNLDWNDAAAYCRWLSEQEQAECRLPTEAEWEYACRAGTTTLFSCGDEVSSLAAAANLADRSLAEAAPGVAWAADWNDEHPFTAPVGSFQPNAFGLFDMHGNAAEWCADWYDPDYYRQSPPDDPAGPERGDVQVFRGGAFDNWAGFARSADRRSSHSPTIRTDWAGFRAALSVEGVRKRLGKASSTSQETPAQE